MLEHRIDQGIAWLDEHAPAGWRDRIDHALFDMGSEYSDVLYFAFPFDTARCDDEGLPYATGFDYVSDGCDIRARDYGFDTESYEGVADIKALTRAWLHALRHDRSVLSV